MPAPSMFSTMCRRNSEAVFLEGNTFGNGQHVENDNLDLQRTMADPIGEVIGSPPEQIYDEVFTSRPVSESRTMLWEIKDFENVFSKRMERAMSFEFEVGRLGSMERHLPRRSRWRIALERHATSGFLALRVLQLSPENKVIFYQLNASIMAATGTVPEGETEFKIQTDSPREGSTESKLVECGNVFPFSWNNMYGNGYLSGIQRYLSDGALFIKVTMGIFEDSSH